MGYQNMSYQIMTLSTRHISETGTKARSSPVRNDRVVSGEIAPEGPTRCDLAIAAIIDENDQRFHTHDGGRGHSFFCHPIAQQGHESAFIGTALPSILLSRCSIWEVDGPHEGHLPGVPSLNLDLFSEIRVKNVISAYYLDFSYVNPVYQS
jgi:hypothetical protein